MGYVVLLVALFLPFLFWMRGMVTDHNLLLYKECTKLLMMAGCLLILFALSKNESPATERIRNTAARNALFLTFFLVFANMMWRVVKGDIMNVDTSTFLTFLVVNVLCLEFGMQKARIDKFFKR
jgi:Kef-type K+ transport system membrane component KefB